MPDADLKINSSYCVASIFDILVFNPFCLTTYFKYVCVHIFPYQTLHMMMIELQYTYPYIEKCCRCNLFDTYVLILPHEVTFAES